MHNHPGMAEKNGQTARPEITTVSSDSDHSHNAHSKERHHQAKHKRTVSLSAFILVLAALIGCIVLALGLGLGLGLKQRHRTVQVKSTASNFNYSSFYGIPDTLPVVASENLVNQKELDLNTGFVISNQSQLREFTFNITQALAAPDGYEKPMILINNQFPGPLIEANTGDTIRVHVNNLMSNWSTSVHWHGIDQKNTSYMDGVAAITQCGIPPGKSFTYEFATDEQVGTYWYHSHLGVQYTDGLFGPLVGAFPDSRDNAKSNKCSDHS